MAGNKLLGFIFILGVMSNIAFGDGKFYYIEKVPVGVPYQRALLLFENNKETLLLQSKYKTDEVKDENSIGWVVPVPAVPQLASMDAGVAQFLFIMLSIRTSPTIIPLVAIVVFVGFIVLISVLIVKALKKHSILSWFRIVIGVLVVSMLILAFLLPTMGRSGVDVLKAETVGIYDVKVIKGDDANAVTQWLKENKFGFEDADSKVFDRYVKKGWCFVTAKVSKKTTENSGEITRQGLVAPLILRFDANQPVYPMALTATASGKTDVLLYVCSDHKMNCANKLKLAFFGRVKKPFSGGISSSVEPKGFFEESKSDQCYMSKFRGSLNPQQMNDDIVFKQAGDDKPYREIKWW